MLLEMSLLKVSKYFTLDGKDMNKLLMFLRLVKLLFTEYKERYACWTEFEEDNREVITIQKGKSKLRDRDAGVASMAIPTLGLDGIPPQYERKGNPKRKPHNENRYDSYKKGEIYGRKRTEN